MSGTSRLPSAGTPAPVCHAGLSKKPAPEPRLAPPPDAENPPPAAISAVVSFHPFSGMYSSAEETVSELAPAGDQYGESPPGGQSEAQVGVSAENSFPPAPVTSGMEAGTSTARPLVAVFALLGSQSAAPASPEAAVMVCPWATACCAQPRICPAKEAP